MKERKTAEFIGQIFVNLVCIAIINSVLLWRRYTNGIILDSWTDILWATNLSLVLQIVGNMVLAIYRPARMYSFIQAIHAAAGLLSIVVFYMIFPLDFSHVAGNWLETLAKAVLIIAMAGTSIGLVVNLGRAASRALHIPAQNK